MGGGGQTAAPTHNEAAEVGEPPGGPVGAPLSTPQPNEGMQQEAMVNLSMAMDLMEGSLGAFGTGSPEGQAVHKALGALVKVLGPQREKAQDLQGAELMQLMSSLPQAGGGSPEMAAGAGAPPPGAGAPPPPMQ